VTWGPRFLLAVGWGPPLVPRGHPQFFAIWASPAWLLPSLSLHRESVAAVCCGKMESPVM